MIVMLKWNEAMELLNKFHMGTTLQSNIYDSKNSSVVTGVGKDYSILYEFNLFNPLKTIIKTLPGPDPEHTSDLEPSSESPSEEEYNSEIEPETTTTSEPELFSSYVKLSLSFLISMILLLL